MSEKTYKIIKQIGKGSFGTVYLCQNLKLKELCVVKRINLSKLDNKEKEETINESKILQKLDHQNIIKFIEVFIEKKSQTTLNIVTEYADDGDLSQKINSQPKKNLFPENLILDYFTQICLALKHIHDKKIIHRDLKSQNIFLTKKGFVKLGDFGVAKNLQNTWKKASTIIGTPYYLSPEIVMSKPYSFKSDIWSLGVLLYEMMSLKMPFDAVSLPMLTLKIMKGDYPPPPSIYSRDLRNLVSLLLNVSPEKRPDINQILRNSFIKDRIKNFLKENEYNKDFSVTIVNNYNMGKIQKKNTQNYNTNKNMNNINNNSNSKNTNASNNNNNAKNSNTNNNNDIKNLNTNINNNIKNTNSSNNNNNVKENNNNSNSKNNNNNNDKNSNNSKNILNNDNNNLQSNNNNNIKINNKNNIKNINIKSNINNFNNNKKEDNKKKENNINNNNVNLAKKDLSKFLNKEEKKENSNNNIKKFINNPKKEDKKDDKPQIKLQIKSEPKSDEKNNKEKEKNSPQSKFHNQNIRKSYHKEGIKLISPIKKDNPVLIKLSMNNNNNNNNNKIKEISNSEQITKRPLSKTKEQKISNQSSNNKNNQNSNIKNNNLNNNKNLNLNKNNTNNNNIKNINNKENIISERIKTESYEIKQRKSINIKKTPTQKERLKEKEKNQKKIITSPEEDLKKLRELMEKGKKELEKHSTSTKNNNINNYTNSNKENEHLTQMKKEHDFITQSHKQFFPNVILVEKKLELNDENSNNQNVKIKRISTNPIDNYLNSFMNNEEKENLKKKKEDEYNYDKNRFFIELDKNANDNNILEENINEEHNTINNTTFETNNNEIENDKIEIPNDIEIDNKNNDDDNKINSNYESDFGKIEELKIQLEKSLGAELFKDIYHIVDETTDLNEIKFDEEKVKSKIKKEWSSNKKYKQNEIDNAVQKIPEVFSIISQERISTFQ